MARTQPTVDKQGYATILNANQFDFDIARHNFTSSKSLIDISISTSPWKDVLYTAVWAPSSSEVDTIVAGNITAQQFQNWVKLCINQGRRITTISATSSGVGARFAGIAVRQPGDRSVLNSVVVDLKDPNQGTWPTGASLYLIKPYGTTDSPLYAILFYTISPDYFPMAYWTTTPKDNLESYENAYMAMKTYSPYWITVNGQERTVYFSPMALGNWEIRTNLTQSCLSQHLQSVAAQNLHPVRLQQVDATHYDVITAQNWLPPLRAWSMTSPAATPKNYHALATGLDELLNEFMRAKSIRHAQVVVGETTGTTGSQTTNIYISRAYTWSEPGTYVANTTDKFLLASVSKAFSIQATNLIIRGVGLAQGKTAPNIEDKIFDLLGYTGKLPKDSRISRITISQCINMRSGIQDQYAGKPSDDAYMDPTSNSRKVAEWVASFNGRSTQVPIVVTDLIDFKFYNGELDHDPGTDGYANINNVFLAHLVEVSSGLPYMQYLNKYVLPPLTIANEVSLWATAASAHINDSIVQECWNVGYSAIDPNSSALVPSIYGGDGTSKESCMGNASLACSATTLVKFIGRCATSGMGGRAPGLYREGTMDGAKTWIYSSHKNNLDLAIVLNTRDGIDESLYNDAKILVDAWKKPTSV